MWIQTSICTMGSGNNELPCGTRQGGRGWSIKVPKPIWSLLHHSAQAPLSPLFDVVALMNWQQICQVLSQSFMFGITFYALHHVWNASDLTDYCIPKNLPSTRAQHFLQICTHIQSTPMSDDLCPPMPIRGIQIAPMYSKIVTLPIISHPCPPKSHGHGQGHPMQGYAGHCSISMQLL